MDSVADEYLKGLVTGLEIEGGDPGHDYVLNYETGYFAGAGLYRVRLFLRDVTIGQDIAIWGKAENRDFSATQPETVLISTDVTLPGYSGVTATAWIDWSRIDWSRTNLTGYDTIEQAGIRSERITGRAEIMRRFASAAEPRVRLTVGAGPTSDTHFNSFAAALASLYIPGVEITRSTYPCSDLCTFSRQVLIECTQDGYSEAIESVVHFGIEESPLLLPPFVTLRGRGDTRLVMTTATGSAPVLEAPFPFRLENIVLENRSKGYAIHIDNQNEVARRSTIGPAVLYYPMMSVMKGVVLEGGTRQSSWLLGIGLSNGQTIYCEDCRFTARGGTAVFGAHTSPDTTDAGSIEFVRTVFDESAVPGVASLELLKSHQMSVSHRGVLVNSTVGEIRRVNSVGGPPAFVF